MLARPISFCDRVGFNIIDADFKARTLADLDARFGQGVLRRHHDRFESVARVTRAPHAVCLRSNGNPYYLFLTRAAGAGNLAIFIDKKVQSGHTQPRMIVAPFQMRADAFEDNVLDGEMARDCNGDWVFLVNDAPGLGGRGTDDQPFARRLAALTALLERCYTPSALDVCALQVKRFLPAARATELVHGLAPALTYTNRGLLFKPLRGGGRDVLYNFDDSLVRTPAPPVKQCKDRVVESLGPSPSQQPAPARKPPPPPPLVITQRAVVRGNGPDTYNMVDGGGQLRVVTLAESRALRALFEGVPAGRAVTVKCAWDPKFERWCFRV